MSNDLLVKGVKHGWAHDSRPDQTPAAGLTKSASRMAETEIARLGCDTEPDMS